MFDSPSLKTLRRVTSGRLICVLGEGDAASAAVRSQRGRAAERFADIRILTSDDPGNDRPLEAAHDLLDGFRDPAKAEISPNRVRAIRWALDRAAAGDTVLVAGPHNGRPAQHDDEFVVDADVVRYCLLDREPEDTTPVPTSRWRGLCEPSANWRN